MGDAVRRVQKHLQDLSRDHLTSVEDRHHANLGWLQIELQQLCKQIEVEVRVELTRPPRLSFSKGATALPPPSKDSSDKPASHSAVTKPKTPVLPSPLQSAATRLVFDAVEDDKPPRGAKKRRLDETKKTSNSKTAETTEIIDVVAIDPAQQPSVDHAVVNVVTQDNETSATAAPVKRMVKRVVKLTRTVLKPKKIVKKVKILVKEEKVVLPPVDISALKVVDLKSELKKRGLKQTGVKAVLAARLHEALEAEDAAQAADEDDGAETWVTEEVEEEIMEELEEEYEEEIEEEEVMTGNEPSQATTNKNDTVEALVIDAAAENESLVAIVEQPLDDAFTIQPSESVDKEVAQMAREDVSAAPQTSETEAPDTNVDLDQQANVCKSVDTVPQKSSPKKSLSDLVSPMADDEIVQESDVGPEGFSSPEGKPLPGKAESTRKSPRRKSSSSAVHSAHAEPPSKSAPSPDGSRTDRSTESVEPTVAVDSAETKNAKTTQSASAPVEPVVVEKHVTEAQAHSPASLKATSPAEEPVASNAPRASSNRVQVIARPIEPQSTGLSKVGTAPRTQETKTSAGVSSDARTPSRDLMERVKSLASSSRSSSVSSFSAARRYTGSISYVEDSQPEQSPLRRGYAPDISTHTARPASVSELEIEKLTSMKTPDSGSSAPATTERVTHSEPRVNAAKQQVEDDEERKRREQQENIQREAQRLRMAMKQSAKKRFEEAKGTALFWPKRDLPQTDATGDQTRKIESSSDTTSQIPQASDPLAAEPSATEAKSSTAKASAVKTVVVDQFKQGKGTKTVSSPPVSAPVAPKVKLAAPPSSLPESVPSRENESKRPPQTRKRSSIVLDSSTSTLYPSKRRTSSSRGKELNEIPKRSSLTKATSGIEKSRKQTSTERDAVEAKEAPKRKRSSLTKDRAPPASVNKRKSLNSSQDQTSNRAHISSNSNTVQKPSTTASRIGAPTSTASKRRDSVSSTISSCSSVSTTENRPKPVTSVMSGGPVRKPSNLVSGLHSFTSLLEKDSANLSSSQSSNTSASSRQGPGVSALKLAEKSRLLEQKKMLEKAKRKEALAKKYEEQRKADDDKRKKIALMKEKAEKEARAKREEEQATEKKQRELELAKKRQQRLQEMRSGLEKKKALAGEKESVASSKTTSAAVPVSRTAGATASVQFSKSASKLAQNAHSIAQSNELTTYAMSENEASSDSDNEKDTDRNSKNIPKWAQRDHLERALRNQFGPNAVDPTPLIFPDFVDSCDLEAIFEPTDVRKKKRFQRRTSSGNWLGDRPTAKEKAVYKKDMGFLR